MNKQRTHQGGWIANFLIVGVLLVFGLVGTVYFLKSRSADEVVTNDTDIVQDETVSRNDEQKDTAGDKQPDSTNEKEPTTSDASGSSDEQVAQQRDLPASGPTETFQALTGLSLLAFSASAYVQSRHARKF